MKNKYYDGSAENHSLSLPAALLLKSIIKTAPSSTKTE